MTNIDKDKINWTTVSKVADLLTIYDSALDRSSAIALSTNALMNMRDVIVDLTSSLDAMFTTEKERAERNKAHV